jgi:hypothetical protein
MCPVCFSSVAWLITGGVSVLGATAGSNRSRQENSHKNIEDLETEDSRALPSGLVFRGLKTNIETENSK